MTRIASIYRRQRVRANRAAGLCRCGRTCRPGRESCGCGDRDHGHVSLSDAAYDLVRKASLRSGRSMRAILDEIVRDRLKRMGAS